MSRPFINCDLFNIGMSRHCWSRPCCRLSGVGRVGVQGKPAPRHRCQYSCSLLTIRLPWIPGIKWEMTRPRTLILTLHLIPATHACPSRDSCFNFFLLTLLLRGEKNRGCVDVRTRGSVLWCHSNFICSITDVSLCSSGYFTVTLYYGSSFSLCFNVCFQKNREVRRTLGVGVKL